MEQLLLDNIFERVIYGESLLAGVRSDANRFNETALQANNILGKMTQHFRYRRLGGYSRL